LPPTSCCKAMTPISRIGGAAWTSRSALSLSVASEDT
jgi:hypothetical protein